MVEMQKVVLWKLFSLQKQFDFDQAEEKLKAANESLTLAHNAQTDMLIAEAQGEEKILLHC